MFVENICFGIIALAFWWKCFVMEKLYGLITKIMDSSRKKWSFCFWMKDALSSESLRSKGMMIGWRVSIKYTDFMMGYQWKSIDFEKVQRSANAVHFIFYWFMIHFGSSGQRNITTICFRQLNSIMACHLRMKQKYHIFVRKKTWNFLLNLWKYAGDWSWDFISPLPRHVMYKRCNPQKISFCFTNSGKVFQLLKFSNFAFSKNIIFFPDILFIFWSNTQWVCSTLSFLCVQNIINTPFVSCFDKSVWYYCRGWWLF